VRTVSATGERSAVVVTIGCACAARSLARGGLRKPRKGGDDAPPFPEKTDEAAGYFFAAVRFFAVDGFAVRLFEVRFLAVVVFFAVLRRFAVRFFAAGLRAAVFLFAVFLFAVFLFTVRFLAVFFAAVFLFAVDLFFAGDIGHPLSMLMTPYASGVAVPARSSLPTPRTARRGAGRS
jgi:hypothetical protein